MPLDKSHGKSHPKQISRVFHGAWPFFRPEPSSRNIGVEDRHKDLQRKDVLR